MSAPVSDDDCLATLARYNENGRNVSATARASGQNPKTIYKHLRVAAERGLMLDHPPAMPGFAVKSVATQIGDSWVKQTKEPGETFEVPKGLRLKGVSALTDAEGRVIQSWQIARTDPGGLDPLQIAEGLKAAFANYEPSSPSIFGIRGAAADLLTIIPAGDWHMGLHVWGKEAEADWDLKIAERTIGAAVNEAIERAPAAGVAVLLGGGDLLHADNSSNQTSRSGNPLDVDGRYQKIIDVTTRLKVRAVEAMLARNDHVIVRILPGNHDEHACVAVAYFLKAWFRNEPRVTVDVDPSLFWWMRWGRCMFGATHGHTVKIQEMPSIMAHRRAEDWGLTRFRYVHGFHLHHAAKFATEGNGVISEIHQAPVPQDAWHYGAGFLSGRSIQSITYDRGAGEIGRSRVAILDGDKLT